MSYSKSSDSVIDTEPQPPEGEDTGPNPYNYEPDESGPNPYSYEPEDLATADRPEPSPNSKKIPWFLVGSVVLLALGGGYAWQQWQSSKTAGNTPVAAAGMPQGVPVKLASVETSTVQELSEFVGTLEAKRSVEIKPEVEGRVIEIFVRPGDTVEQGQIIARMKSDTNEADLRQAQANLLRTQARLAELQAGTRPESIAEGIARVRQAQARLAELQAGSRPESIAEAQARVIEAESNLADAQSGTLLEEIAQAQAQIEANKAEAELASQQVARYRALAQEGAESENTYQQYLQRDRTAQANLREAQRRLEQRQKNRQAEIERRTAALEQQRQALRLLQNGARPEEIAAAQAEVAQAQSQLARLQNGTRSEELAQAEAQVAEAVAQVRGQEVALQETGISAPFTGVIGDVPVKVGDFLSKGDAMMTLTENQLLDLRLSVPLEREGQLRMGLPVQMIDAQGKVLATGRISFISPRVNGDSQTILAKATFDNRQGTLRDGQFVRARVVWNQRPNSVVVPMTAVISQGEERFVFVAQGQVAKRQPIKLGLIQGDRAEVLEGLEAGQKIVVSGIQKIGDGAPISPIP